MASVVDALRTRSRPLQASYVVLVAGIAALGFLSHSPGPILTAAALSLPVSIIALPAYYLAYGLLALTTGANPSHSSGSGGCSAAGHCWGSTVGDQAIWFTYTSELIGILALAGAALLNVLLLRLVRAARREPL